MKRMLCTFFATLTLVAVGVGTASAYTPTNQFTTVVAQGSYGPMLNLNNVNSCDLNSFQTLTTTVGRTPDTRFQNVTQFISGIFKLYRWNGTAWVFTTEYNYGWHEAVGGYFVFTPVTFHNLAPGYYHLNVEYGWGANGVVIGRVVDNFNGVVYTKYTGIDDGVNNLAGYTRQQANYCYVG